MREKESEQALVEALSDYAETVAGATSPEAAFRYAEQVSHALIGHQLFTVMLFNPVTVEVRRCYSSHVAEYPPGGRKAKKDTAWGRHVLEQGNYFIGYNAEDIRRNFDDYKVIEGLGLASVLNIPIRNLGQTVGTMNLLDKAGFYQPGHVAVATLIASGLVSVLLSINESDNEP